MHMEDFKGPRQIRWIRACLAMAAPRASSSCIRGKRKQPRGAEKELEVDFEDRAGLAIQTFCGRGKGKEEGVE